MDRRTFISTVTLGLLAAPLAAEAQPGAKVPRIGFLAVVSRSEPGIRAFEEQLQKLGYVGSRSIAIEFRTGAANPDLLPHLAAELVRLDIALLVAGGAEPAARAARRVAGTLPIVIVAIDYDPIALKYVSSLARPGGNITGVFLQQIELTTILFQNRAVIARLARENRLPTMSALREGAEAGGLVAYGASLTGMYASDATYVDKILKGARPGDLPIEQPTKFELVINLKTAKALGLSIPPSLLQRADQVIE
jgi:putative ABC transport system substrate-binding protein